MHCGSITADTTATKRVQACCWVLSSIPSAGHGRHVKAFHHVINSSVMRKDPRRWTCGDVYATWRGRLSTCWGGFKHVSRLNGCSWLSTALSPVSGCFEERARPLCDDTTSFYKEGKRHLRAERQGRGQFRCRRQVSENVVIHGLNVYLAPLECSWGNDTFPVIRRLNYFLFEACVSPACTHTHTRTHSTSYRG